MFLRFSSFYVESMLVAFPVEESGFLSDPSLPCAIVVSAALDCFSFCKRVPWTSYDIVRPCLSIRPKFSDLVPFSPCHTFAPDRNFQPRAVFGLFLGSVPPLLLSPGKNPFFASPLR